VKARREEQRSFPLLPFIEQVGTDKCHIAI
jgi:hypothetical protein